MPTRPLGHPWHSYELVFINDPSEHSGVGAGVSDDDGAAEIVGSAEVVGTDDGTMVGADDGAVVGVEVGKSSIH